MQYYYKGSNYYKKYPFQVFVHESTTCGALHGQDFYELFITYSQNCVHYINGERAELPYGAAVLAGPRDVHRVGPNDDQIFKYINLSFSNEVLLDLERYLHAEGEIQALFTSETRRQVVLSVSQTEKWIARMKQLARTKMTDGRQLEMEMRSLLAQLFTKVFVLTSEDKGDAEEPLEHMPTWLEALCSYINADMHFALSLDELAHHAGRTKEHLCRSMKKYLGVSPMQYINHVRMLYAASMLENSDMSITDIGLEAGFFSSSYFNKLFRETYGISPREYRRIHQ